MRPRSHRRCPSWTRSSAWSTPCSPTRAGAPGTAAQTHASLVTYLVEETYELVEAIEVGTADDVREELGDVLYQVVLHALWPRAPPRRPVRRRRRVRSADVARDAAAKSRAEAPPRVRGRPADDVDDIVRLWSAAKAREKSHRRSASTVSRSGSRLWPGHRRSTRGGLRGRRTARAGSAPTARRAPPVAGAESTELGWGRALLAQVDEATDVESMPSVLSVRPCENARRASAR